MNLDPSLVDAMVAWRRDLHAHPETAFAEVRTADLVARELAAAGIAVHRGLGKTGVVGTLANGDGGAVGLRADMDALDVEEHNRIGHASRNPGKMHACGHDGHTAMLLGAAQHLARHRDFRGTVHFIFQPAEENEGGGRAMVDEGLFDRFPCDAVFGMHNWPGLPAGHFAINHGPMMAAFDRFEIVVRGKGTHAAMPERGIDPFVSAAQIVLALQTIPSRRLSALEPVVVSVTQIHGGATWNIIPESVVIRGGVRCFAPAARDAIEAAMREICTTLAAAHGATATVDYRRNYPATINTPAETDVAIAAARAVAGVDHVQFDCQPSTASEDFAYLLQAKPGAYIWLGADGAQPSAPLHSPSYDFNDEILPIGAAYWIRLVQEFLGSPVAARGAGVRA